MKLFLKEAVGYYCYYGENGEHLYYHRYVASQKLGRELKQGECVHHIDGNKLNNNIENLLVFRSGIDHTKHHANPEIPLILNEDGSYSFNDELVMNKCLHCSTLTRNKQFCSQECKNAYNDDKLTEWIDVEELEKLILTKTFVEIGKMFNMTDNAIRNRCKKLGLPTSQKEKILYFDLPYYTTEEVVEMRKRKTTIKEISKITGYSEGKICSILKTCS